MTTPPSARTASAARAARWDDPLPSITVTGCACSEASARCTEVSLREALALSAPEVSSDLRGDLAADPGGDLDRDLGGDLKDGDSEELDDAGDDDDEDESDGEDGDELEDALSGTRVSLSSSTRRPAEAFLLSSLDPPSPHLLTFSASMRS